MARNAFLFLEGHHYERSAHSLNRRIVNPLIIGLDAFPATLVSAAFLAPLIEEFSKTYPLFYRHGETQRSIVRLALMIGLRFGVEKFFCLHTPRS